MVRSVLVVATAAVLLAVGALTAAAGNRHVHSGQAAAAAAIKGQAITALTAGAMLEVKAHDDVARAQAASLEAAKADAARAAAAQAGTQAQPSPAEADEPSDADVDDQQNNSDEGDSNAGGEDSSD